MSFHFKPINDVNMLFKDLMGYVINAAIRQGNQQILITKSILSYQFLEKNGFKNYEISFIKKLVKKAVPKTIKQQVLD